MSYFVSILSVGNLFLPGSPQILSLRFRSISKPYKSSIQTGKSFYIYIYIYMSCMHGMDACVRKHSYNWVCFHYRSFQIL